MIPVVLLGGGNLAFHLAQTFAESEEIDLLQVYNRTLANINELEKFAPTTDDLEKLVPAAVYIIATSDKAIPELSAKLNDVSGLVVHTSGAMEMSVLSPKKKGVLYPLQSFTKDKNVNFESIPLCIETEETQDYVLLEKLAKTMSSKVYPMTSAQRKKLHIAAVFVNNFVNYMYGMGEQICQDHDIPFEVLLPLIKETAQKMETLTPNQAQTGPASRNDKKTIALHKQELTKEQLTIYNLLSEAILKKNKDGNKL